MEAQNLPEPTSESGADAQRVSTLDTESDSEAERIFSALSTGGQVLMPMQEAFFASRFGQLRGPFRDELDGPTSMPHAGKVTAVVPTSREAV